MWLIHPAKVRASRTPSRRPIITVPMARPRSLWGTRSGAMGSTMWVTEATTPSRTLAAISQASVGASGDQKQRHNHGGEHPPHQRAALQQIAQGHKEQQSQSVANLGRAGDIHHAAGGRAVGLAHLHQQRLVEVDGGDADGARQPEEVQRSARRGGFGTGSHSQSVPVSSVSPAAHRCCRCGPCRCRAELPSPGFQTLFRRCITLCGGFADFSCTLERSNRAAMRSTR